MIDETTTKRGQLRGYIFEVVIRHLLCLNNFKIITENVSNRVRTHNSHHIEIKGRGTWHQIDSPCLYEKSVPFTYDLRLLAEVKFHTREIQKEKVREFMGVIKDISENYFIEGDYSIENQTRYTDIGVFFAANGFQPEAEKLAFVHGIKTILYKNNQLMENIKNKIMDLEKHHLRADNCISSGNRIKFMDDLLRILQNPNNNGDLILFREDYGIENGVEILNDLILYSNKIITSFFGITSTNYFLHFISNSVFPSRLFERVDERMCRIRHTQSGNFYLTIDGDETETRFYFAAPEPLFQLIFSSPQKVASEKISHFEKIKVSITLNSIQRSLVLKLNQDWLGQFIDNQSIPIVQNSN